MYCLQRMPFRRGSLKGKEGNSRGDLARFSSVNINNLARHVNDVRDIMNRLVGVMIFKYRKFDQNNSAEIHFRKCCLFLIKQ